MPFGGPRDPIQRTILGLRNLWLNDETKIAADYYQHDSSNPPQQARTEFLTPTEAQEVSVSFGEKMFKAVILVLKYSF